MKNTETDGALDILARMAESGELIVNGINWAGVALERIEDRDVEIERLKSVIRALQKAYGYGGTKDQAEAAWAVAREALK